MNDKEEFKKAVIECCVNGTMTIKVAISKKIGIKARFNGKWYKEIKIKKASNLTIL